MEISGCCDVQDLKPPQSCQMLEEVSCYGCRGMADLEVLRSSCPRLQTKRLQSARGCEMMAMMMTRYS